jgi:hypothetical protein
VAWTPADFKARWTEFAFLDDDLVQAALDEAVRECDARVYRDRYDDAVGLLACHNLAISPAGQQARLESDKGTTTYWGRFAEIRKQKAGGPRLAGVC